MKLGGNTIFWKCLFQTIVAHSSTESELMALDKGCTTGQLAKWVCLAVGRMPVLPIPIFVDNQSAVTLGSNPIQSGRNLHMHARYFYVRDMIKAGEYILHYRPVDEGHDQRRAGYVQGRTKPLAPVCTSHGLCIPTQDTNWVGVADSISGLAPRG